MRARVTSLTIGLPRSARDTVGCETPARCAITSEVALSFVRMMLAPAAVGALQQGYSADWLAPVLLRSSKIGQAMHTYACITGRYQGTPTLPCPRVPCHASRARSATRRTP